MLCRVDKPAGVLCKYHLCTLRCLLTHRETTSLNLALMNQNIGYNLEGLTRVPRRDVLQAQMSHYHLIHLEV